MSEAEKKEALINITEELLIEGTLESLKTKIRKAVNSGAIDIDSWDGKHKRYVLPKTIMVAVLESEASSYDGRGTDFAKQVRSNVKNLKCFI